MALFLLLGFAVAGLLSVFISPAWLEHHLGGRGLAPVFKASLFGVPLPLCSCGVIPVSASLKQHGASRAATTAFLLSTPQTGVDSVMVTWTMLGPVFAVFRPVVALLTGLLGGSLVQALVPEEEPDSPGGQQLSAVVGSVDDRPVSWRAKLQAAWAYATVTLPGDINRALLFGILIAGFLAAAVPENFLGAYLGTGALSIALMMVVGIPLYVCATASVPLAVGFITLGATPGAALAFLVAGPATNAATLTTISRVLGRRTMIVYLLTVAISAFGGGLLLDWLLPRAALALPAFSGTVHIHETVGWLGHLSGALLVSVLAWSWWKSRQHDCGCDGTVCESPAQPLGGLEPVVAKREFDVTGMNCSHCAASVDRALRELPGVSNCQVRLEDGRVTVEGPVVNDQLVIEAVTGLGYQAQVRNPGPS